MQMRKWPWSRIVTGVVAAGLLSFAIPLFFECVDEQHRADEARESDLIHWKVDLSKPGQYKGAFHHNYDLAHCQYIAIVTDPPLTSSEEATTILEGLKGRLSVVDSDGGVVFEKPIDAKYFGCRKIEEKNWMPEIDFGHFALGKYELRVVVDHGGPRLASVSQTLVARYFLCGLERTINQVMWLLGLGACTIAGILILVVVRITIKKRRIAAT
jgi:hypothetical protein